MDTTPQNQNQGINREFDPNNPIDRGRRQILKAATEALVDELLTFVQSSKWAKVVNESYPGINARTDRGFSNGLLHAYNEKYNDRVLALRQLIDEEFKISEAERLDRLNHTNLVVFNSIQGEPMVSNVVFELIEKRAGWLALMASRL